MESESSITYSVLLFAHVHGFCQAYAENQLNESFAVRMEFIFELY